MQTGRCKHPLSHTCIYICIHTIMHTAKALLHRLQISPQVYRIWSGERVREVHVGSERERERERDQREGGRQAGSLACIWCYRWGAHLFMIPVLINLGCWVNLIRPLALLRASRFTLLPQPQPVRVPPTLSFNPHCKHALSLLFFVPYK